MGKGKAGIKAGEKLVAERKVKIPLPGQPGFAEGTEIALIESVERWTELKLEDGSVLRVKPTIVSVIRLDGRYDPQGNPMYAIRGGQTMVIGSTPEHLREQKNNSKVQ